MTTWTPGHLGSSGALGYGLLRLAYCSSHVERLKLACGRDCQRFKGGGCAISLGHLSSSVVALLSETLTTRRIEFI